MKIGLFKFVSSACVTSVVLLLSACQSSPTASSISATPVATPVPAPEIRAEMDPLVKEYLMLSTVETQIDEVLDVVFGSLKQNLEQVPDAFWIEQRANVDRDEMHRSAADLVSEYYTQEELETVVAFLRSDEGVKFIQGTEKLNQRQAHRSAAWARKVRDNLIFELKLKRYM